MRGLSFSQESTNAFLIAMVLCINTFSKILGMFITIPYNIAMMETALLLTLVLCNDGQLIIGQTLTIILIIVACIMGYSLLLWTFDARVVERLLKFVMYALFTMICIQYPFEEKTLQWAVFLIGIMHAAYLFSYAVPRLNSGAMSLDDTMDLSYTSLMYLFVASNIASDRRIKLLHRLAAAMMSLIFAYFLLAVSTNRGALVAAGCFYVLRLVQRCRRKEIRVFLFCSLIVILLVFLMNCVTILETVDAWTTSKGLVINPLRKTLWQLTTEGSMDSGREENYAAAIQLIKDSWALPNGVAGYHIITNVAYYPHNIFLEAGVEFGVIGFIMVAAIILKACYCMVIASDKYSRFLVVLFCLSVPRLMVSSSYWENSYLWPMMIMMWPEKTNEILPRDCAVLKERRTYI